MSLNHSETPRRKGALRGRESRDQSLNTKLTRREFAVVNAASEADGRTIGEWVREAVLKAARTSFVCVTTDDLMTEIVALQLFLTEVLSPVARGERMTAEQYQGLMRSVKTNKHRAAREVIAQYVAENEEEHHA
jgi:hypothetical protein